MRQKKDEPDFSNPSEPIDFKLIDFDTVNAPLKINYANPQKSSFPIYLGRHARKIIVDTIEMFKTNGLSNMLDPNILLMFAKAMEKYHQYEYLFAMGLVQETSWDGKKYVKSVHYEIHKTNQDHIRSLSTMLLLTPNSRKSTKLNESKKDSQNLSDFLPNRSKSEPDFDENGDIINTVSEHQPPTPTRELSILQQFLQQKPK